MLKEFIGLMTRHGVGYAGGALVGYSMANGLDIDTIENILGLIAMFAAAGLSTIDKVKKKKEVKELENFIDKRQYND